jgi:hypothetical protein
MSASTPRGIIAKDACTDLFDSIGVNLELLQPLLEDLLQDASRTDSKYFLHHDLIILRMTQKTLYSVRLLCASLNLSCSTRP